MLSHPSTSPESVRLRSVGRFAIVTAAMFAVIAAFLPPATSQTFLSRLQVGDWEKVIGSWDEQCDVGTTIMATSPLDANTIYLARNGGNHGCGVFKSTDGGRI